MPKTFAIQNFFKIRSAESESEIEYRLRIVKLFLKKMIYLRSSHEELEKLKADQITNAFRIAPRERNLLYSMLDDQNIQKKWDDYLNYFVPYDDNFKATLKPPCLDDLGELTEISRKRRADAERQKKRLKKATTVKYVSIDEILAKKVDIVNDTPLTAYLKYTSSNFGPFASLDQPKTDKPPVSNDKNQYKPFRK